MADYAGGRTQTLAAATSAEVLPPKFGRRIAFSIANVGANSAFVNMSDSQNTAVADSSIYLAPGGILTDSNMAAYECWQGTITGISTAGTTLAIWERVRL